MINQLLGTKIGMSQIIGDDGEMTPVTYVSVESNEIMQLKSVDKDGYAAVVLGAMPKAKPSKNKKFNTIKECKVDSIQGLNIGDKVDLSGFEGVETVTVTGVSKGRGTAGPVKRWNRSAERKTHGTKDIRHGSTMNSSITGRTRKGLKMAGRMGNDRITLKNRKVGLIDAQNNVIAIKGAVPGAIGGLVIIKKEN